MMDCIFEAIASNGVWAVLFFFLLVLEIKDSREREAKYQDTVNSLTETLHTVDKIGEDVDDILECVIDMKGGRSDGAANAEEKRP